MQMVGACTCASRNEALFAAPDACNFCKSHVLFWRVDILLNNRCSWRDDCRCLRMDAENLLLLATCRSAGSKLQAAYHNLNF